MLWGLQQQQHRRERIYIGLILVLLGLVSYQFASAPSISLRDVSAISSSTAVVSGSSTSSSYTSASAGILLSASAPPAPGIVREASRGLVGDRLSRSVVSEQHRQYGQQDQRQLQHIQQLQQRQEGTTAEAVPRWSDALVSRRARVLILVLSGEREGDEAQRASVFETWASNSTYVVTSGPVNTPNVIRLPPEAEAGGYKGLPIKVLRYLLPMVIDKFLDGYDFVMKADPDTYINVERLEVCTLTALL